MGEFVQHEHTHGRIGQADAFQHIAELGARRKFHQIGSCALHTMPGELERGINGCTVLGSDEYRVVKLVKLHAQEGRLPLVAHAVQDAHGKLVALLIGLGDIIRRLVGHPQQIIDLSVESCRVHRHGEGIDRVAHVFVALPTDAVAVAGQILHQTRIVALLPRHDGRQCGMGEHRLLEIVSQRIAVVGIQILA